MCEYRIDPARRRGHRKKGLLDDEVNQLEELIEEDPIVFANRLQLRLQSQYVNICFLSPISNSKDGRLIKMNTNAFCLANDKLGGLKDQTNGLCSGYPMTAYILS